MSTVVADIYEHVYTFLCDLASKIIKECQEKHLSNK